MTHDEIVKAAEEGSMIFCTINGADVLYKRISCINWRFSGEEDLKRGMPKKYMQVELESLTAPSVTVADPRSIRPASEI